MTLVVVEVMHVWMYMYMHSLWVSDMCGQNTCKRCTRAKAYIYGTVNVPISHSMAKLTHSQSWIVIQVKEWDQGFPSIPEIVAMESLIKISS